MSEIGLLINDRVYGGWKGASVDLSIESLSGTFNLTLSDKWDTAAVADSIKPHDACSITINGQVVITGFIDIVNLSMDGSNHQIQVTGRDRAADLIDCTVDGVSQFINLTLPQIITRLCNPFGVGVNVNIETGDPFKTFNVEQGSTVHEIIQKLCAARGCLAISDGAGNILITRAGSQKQATPIIQGVNMLSGQASNDSSNRFSVYRVKGQAQNTSQADVNSSTGNMASAIDESVTRFRPLTIIAEGQATIDDCAKRAAWELATRRARSRRYTIAVNGWLQELDKTLWAINKLVFVESAALDVRDTLLVAGVNFSLSESGEVTTLTLTPQDAYSVLDVPIEPNGNPYQLPDTEPADV